MHNKLFTVKLQDPFSYHTMWIWIAGGLLALFLLAYFLIPWIVKKSKMPRKRKVKESKPSRQSIRKAYLRKVDELEQRLKLGELSPRDAHQELSTIIRNFAKDMSGMDTTKSTLTDIRRMKEPRLENVIEMYYTPEFSEHEATSASEAIEITRKVMMQWN